MLNGKKATAKKQFWDFLRFWAKIPPKSTLMPPKIKIMASTSDFRSRQLTTASFRQIGDRPQTLPPDLGEPPKKPLLIA